MKPVRGPLEVIVYFVDPKELWAERVEKVALIHSEVLRFEWLWLARIVARSNMGNAGNTCWVIRNAVTGEVYESHVAERPRVQGL